jgi:hypothetical protein
MSRWDLPPSGAYESAALHLTLYNSPLSLNIAHDTSSLETIFVIVSCSKITTLCGATRDFTDYFLLFILSPQK